MPESVEGNFRRAAYVSRPAPIGQSRSALLKTDVVRPGNRLVVLRAPRREREELGEWAPRAQAARGQASALMPDDTCGFPPRYLLWRDHTQVRAAVGSAAGTWCAYFSLLIFGEGRDGVCRSTAPLRKTPPDLASLGHPPRRQTKTGREKERLRLLCDNPAAS